MKRTALFTVATCLGLALSACSPSFQTTSGAQYVADARGPMDADIAKAANIEPDLRLPARIGLARVVNGALTSIPVSESDQFANLAQSHTNMGEFVPVSPMIAAMVTDAASSRDTIKQIRLASARQHLDYVIVYEVGARSRKSNTPFALADVTLIGGMLLPTRQIDVTGIGQVVFLDVRNAYPYATVGTTTDLTGFARTFQASMASNSLRDQAVAKVVTALIPEVDEMLRGLTARADRR
ncbi:MAG: hypothetical protein ACWA40_06320 [Planktomarina sp.]